MEDLELALLKHKNKYGSYEENINELIVEVYNAGYEHGKKRVLDNIGAILDQHTKKESLTQGFIDKGYMKIGKRRFSQGDET